MEEERAFHCQSLATNGNKRFVWEELIYPTGFKSTPHPLIRVMRQNKMGILTYFRNSDQNYSHSATENSHPGNQVTIAFHIMFIDKAQQSISLDIWWLQAMNVVV